jgi:hypothetical protein
MRTLFGAKREGRRKRVGMCKRVTRKKRIKINFTLTCVEQTEEQDGSEGKNHSKLKGNPSPACHLPH